MLSKITLASLLLVSTSVFAHTADDPQHAHQAYWRDSSGSPILDGNSNCVRTGSFAAHGSPSCYPPVTATQAESEEKVLIKEATPTSLTGTEVASVEAGNSEPVVMEKRAPESPKAEVVETATAATPTTEPTKQAVKDAPAAVTYSYPVETVGTHIYFDFDKNNLRIVEQEKLEAVVIAAMQAHKVVKVSVEGHADSRGTDAYNYDLSQRRINTVVNYLNLRGIETNSTMAWGESKLIYFADGSENYDHSRRAEVSVRIMHKVKDN